MDIDLTGTRQIEMTQTPNIARLRSVLITHDYLSIVAPEAFTIAVHFGISAAI
jgi:hypothetical protein